MSDCIFCKIVTGEVPSHRVYEDDQVLVIADVGHVNPAIDDGPPGPRTNRTLAFYAGYFRDPDGNKLNFFCMG